MTVTTHSPETNLFLSILKSDKQHTPKARIVWEDVWSIYDACVSWRRWWQKQSNKLILLSAIFYPNRYIVSCYFFQNEWGTSCTLQKILEQMWLKKKKRMNQIWMKTCVKWTGTKRWNTMSGVCVSSSWLWNANKNIWMVKCDIRCIMKIQVRGGGGPIRVGGLGAILMGWDYFKFLLKFFF